MTEILLPFTYVYAFRMRPNAFPKPKYSGMLIMDSDAPFRAEKVYVMLDGREDERLPIILNYSVKCGEFVFRADASLDSSPGWRFDPGQPVSLELSRGAAKLAKLRKVKDGGVGMNIEVALMGVKTYSPHLLQNEVLRS